MGLLSRLFGETKSSSPNGWDTQWHELTTLAPPGRFASYNTQVQDGYSANPYIAKCVDLIADVIASLEPIIFDAEGNEVQEPSLRRLLLRPNSEMSWSELVYESISDFELNGNAFCLPLQTLRGIDELWRIPPNNVTVEETSDIFGPVRTWIVSNGTGAIRLAPRDLIHVRGKLSVDSVMGISKLEAAGLSITQQTEARRWNLALLRNGAKPSIVILDPKDMNEGQFQDFVRRVSQGHSGTNKAGSVMVLDGGKTISTAGFNARDMDYSQGVTTSAREIAIAMGVPPELVGDSANKTYANAQEANREFATHTVIPTAKRFYDALSRRICPVYPGVASIGFDVSQIDGMKGDEAAMMTALQNTTFLTTNEKRARLGYEPVEGGDVIMVAMGQVPLSEVATPIDQLVQQDVPPS